MENGKRQTAMADIPHAASAGGEWQGMANGNGTLRAARASREWQWQMAVRNGKWQMAAETANGKWQRKTANGSGRRQMAVETANGNGRWQWKRQMAMGREWQIANGRFASLFCNLSLPRGSSVVGRVLFNDTWHVLMDSCCNAHKRDTPRDI